MENRGNSIKILSTAKCRACQGRLVFGGSPESLFRQAQRAGSASVGQACQGQDASIVLKGLLKTCFGRLNEREVRPYAGPAEADVPGKLDRRVGMDEGEDCRPEALPASIFSAFAVKLGSLIYGIVRETALFVGVQ